MDSAKSFRPICSGPVRTISAPSFPSCDLRTLLITSREHPPSPTTPRQLGLVSSSTLGILSPLPPPPSVAAGAALTTTTTSSNGLPTGSEVCSTLPGRANKKSPRSETSGTKPTGRNGRRTSARRSGSSSRRKSRRSRNVGCVFLTSSLVLLPRPGGGQRS